MTLEALVRSLGRSPSDRYTRFRLAGPLDARFVPDATYVEIRLMQMLLRDKRVLWREFIPLGSLVTELQFAGKRQVVPFLVGPDLLVDAPQRSSGEFVEFADKRVAGPFPYRGDDLVLFASLFRFETRDWAKQALSMLASVAKAFDASKLTTYVDIADPLSAGLRGLLGMEDVEARLGIMASYSTPIAGEARASEHALELGYHVFINDQLPAGAADEFTVADGLLMRGGREYRDADFMVLELRALDVRHDHQTFPFHRAHWNKIEEHVAQGREEEAWQRFELLVADLSQCEDLIWAHRAGLMDEYAEQLRARIDHRRQVFSHGGRAGFEGARPEPLSENSLGAAALRAAAAPPVSPEQLIARRPLAPVSARSSASARGVAYRRRERHRPRAGSTPSRRDH